VEGGWWRKWNKGSGGSGIRGSCGGGIKMMSDV